MDLELSRLGYIVFPNKMSYEEREYALSCIKNDSHTNSDSPVQVDYTKLKTFIDNYFLPKTHFKNPVYLKARISNNNNSKDAAVLHSDVYNFTGQPMSIYTALCYFDKAQLELLPGSHHKNGLIKDYSKKIILHLNPGDIVVFNSAIHHRGINFSKGNRRLLQVFDIFPTKEEYSKHVSKFLTVDTNTNSNLLYYVAQIKWLIDIVNIIVYVLSYNDIKYVVFLMDLPPWQKSGKYVSYEPGGRVMYKDGLVDKINVNVIFVESNIVKYSHFYLYVLIALLVCFIIKKS
jgi:hypothetical protein